MILQTNKAERLTAFRELYERAKNASADTFAQFERHRRQYRGDTEIDGSTHRALTVRNITYEIVESQVSSDIPLPKVDASCYSEKRDRNAKAIERLCASLRDKLPFETLNDMDERYTYIYGGSVWFVEWDANTKSGGQSGGIRIHCISPKDFIGQPGICRVEDMDYCFLRFTTTRAELCRRYGVAPHMLSLAECEWESGAGYGEGEEESATLIQCFYRGADGEIGSFAFCGELTLTDIPDYYRRKTRVCKKCGLPQGECTCEKGEFILLDEVDELLHREVVLRDGSEILAFSPATENGTLVESAQGYSMVPTRIPYYTPKHFPIVIRKNTSGEDCLFGQSDCEYLRPQQQAINKIESRILQKLLRAGITPIVPEDATVSLNNAVFGQVIRMKPGESAARYGTVDTTPDISQDIAQAERLYAHAKRTLGISDAYQGIDQGSTESGYAKQLRISQACGRLESKRKMKHTAYAEIDRLIFEYYLAFADEPRSLSYRDAYGRVHNAQFNRYDFISYDIRRGVWYYDDDYLFSVDMNGGAESQRAELWQRNLENLKSGALGDITNPVTLLRYWQCQERAHYPYARENVEYFSGALHAGQTNQKEEEQV